MVRGFAKNLLARQWVDVVGFEHAVSDAADVSCLVGLRVVSHLRGVDGRDEM
jgi:hypothetical protein